MCVYHHVSTAVLAHQTSISHKYLAASSEQAGSLAGSVTIHVTPNCLPPVCSCKQVVLEVVKGGRPALPPVAGLLQELWPRHEPSSAEYKKMCTG
jgi:hypothetical protein